MPHIFLIEDDLTIAHMLSAYIEREWFSVTHASDGRLAEEKFREYTFDLVILDINLPGKTGLELLPIFRSISKVPILMLSARSWEDDKVLSLELWADDYIPKPFSARELLARINRHLIRSAATKEIKISGSEDTYVVGEVSLSLSKFLVISSWIEIKLTKTEFGLLAYLMQHVSEVVERDTLMKEIMGYERYLSDRTIDTHIKNLRKKFDGVLNIETLRAIGYRLHSI